MDKIDNQILNRIQTGFPISPCPFQDLAREFGISEEEVIGRVKKLKEDKVIRRLGAVFDSQKLGFASTLVAMQVPEEQLESAAAIVNRQPGVTHNYQRAASYNLWFTLTAPSAKALEEILEQLKQQTGISKILNMPAIKKFKIRVDFKLPDA